MSDANLQGNVPGPRATQGAPGGMMPGGGMAPGGAPQMGGMPQPDPREIINQHMAPVVQAMALKHQEHDQRLSQLENHLNGLMTIFQSAGKSKINGDRSKTLHGSYGKDLDDLDGVHKQFGKKGLSDHILEAFEQHMSSNPDAKEEHITAFAKPWIDGEKKRIGHFIKGGTISETNTEAGEDKPIEAGKDAKKEVDEITPKKAEEEAEGTAKGGDGVVGDKEQDVKHPSEKDRGGEAPGEEGDKHKEDFVDKLRKSVKRGAAR